MTKKIIHPNFFSNKEDIALLVLGGGFKNIKKFAKLPMGNPYIGTQLTVAGLFFMKLKVEQTNNNYDKPYTNNNYKPITILQIHKQ